jgi:predicted DNA-binding WGR domain protein
MRRGGEGGVVDWGRIGRIGRDEMREWMGREGMR